MKAGVSKYGNRKTVVDGITFDSKKEAQRWKELKLMEKGGYIQALARQVPFELIPAIKDGSGKTVQRAVKYVADFVYMQDDEWVVEDTKGFLTDVYRLKKKVLKWRYGIDVREV